MKLEDLLALCAKSKPEWWKVIPCGGGGAGPSFLDAWRPGAEGRPELTGNHTMRAAYRPDVSLGLAWGLLAHEGFRDTWTDRISQVPASSHFVDFLWNGALVERGLYVTVEGGRCNLPIPQQDLAGARSGAHWITRWQHDFFALLNALEAVQELDRYLAAAGIEVR